MYQVQGEVIGAVFDLKLVEENAQNLRRGHAAVDAHISHRAVGRGEHSRLGEGRQRLRLVCGPWSVSTGAALVVAFVT